MRLKAWFRKKAEAENNKTVKEIEKYESSLLVKQTKILFLRLRRSEGIKSESDWTNKNTAKKQNRKRYSRQRPFELNQSKKDSERPKNQENQSRITSKEINEHQGKQ